MSNPLYAESSTETPQPKSPTAASRGMILHAYLSQSSDRREGYLLSTTHSALAYKGRHLGCARRIRTSSSGYEPEMLPLHHQRDTAVVSSTTEHYPNFLLSLAKLALAPETYLSSVSGWRVSNYIADKPTPITHGQCRRFI